MNMLIFSGLSFVFPGPAFAYVPVIASFLAWRQISLRRNWPLLFRCRFPSLWQCSALSRSSGRFRTWAFVQGGVQIQLFVSFAWLLVLLQHFVLLVYVLDLASPLACKFGRLLLFPRTVLFVAWVHYVIPFLHCVHKNLVLCVFLLHILLEFFLLIGLLNVSLTFVCWYLCQIVPEFVVLFLPDVILFVLDQVEFFLLFDVNGFDDFRLRLRLELNEVEQIPELVFADVCTYQAVFSFF